MFFKTELSRSAVRETWVATLWVKTTNGRDGSPGQPPMVDIHRVLLPKNRSPGDPQLWAPGKKAGQGYSGHFLELEKRQRADGSFGPATSVSQVPEGMNLGDRW